MLKPIPRKLEGVNYMGLTHVPVTVSNLVTHESFTAAFLIDTGATDSMAPASELKRIGIEPVGKRTYELANGSIEEYEFGEARLSFLDETLPTRLIFGPDNVEPILGVFALESAGLVVDPANQTLKRLPALSLK
ncbi:MAG TPA: aspartyl protease family protein [Pyrinomonadaceae bacterium]|nr:aspartyl protease family protein [Pyrinomonadaceae bacterium]